MAEAVSFAERFGREPTVLVRSPGRVNIIGEHTDYNQGYVLPAAIDRYNKLAAAPRTDRMLNVYSEAIDERVEIDLGGHLGLLGETSHWGNYLRGVVWWLREHGYTVVGADVLVWGDLPVGAGLGSSASLLMGMMATLTALVSHEIPRRQMAQACQNIENDFIGVPTGIMDPLVTGLAQPKSALLIDCRSLDTIPVPFNPASHGLSMVIVDSGIRRDIADSEYARRRRECEEALGALRVITYDLQLQSLRDVTPEMLSQHGRKLYPTLYKRAHHVVTENQRVLQAVDALKSEDFERLGQLMNQSHESLRTDFEVSNAFIDRLVELAQQQEGVLGARLTGGGFGGCTVNLIRNQAMRDFSRNVVRRYTEETSIQAVPYVVRPVGGLEVERL
jgi:galactokinase